jgi:hypothetical protein
MGEERCIQRNVRESDHLEGPGVDGSSGSGVWGMDCIDLAKDRVRWRALVNVVMNLRVPYSARNFWTS